MAYIYDIADTWNAIGTTFKGIALNVTDTASAAGSLLMDLQVGGFSQFSVSKAGRVIATALQGTGNSGFIEFSGPSAGILFGGGASGSNRFGYFNASAGVERVTLANTVPFGWSSTSTATGTIDTVLTRDAANTLAQRNGVNPQAFNLYNSYTDVSNYSRLVMYADGSANYYIGTQKAGTGNSASLFVGTGAGSGVAGNGQLTLAGSSIGMTTQAGNIFNITAGGVMSWNSDNTYDIGVSAGNRPRSVYVATSVTPGRGVAVASLPTPSTGMMARVTDATTPTVGSTVTGGGAANAMCWYNGTNWTVIGV